MHKRITRLLATFAVLLGSVLGLQSLNPAPASASASGCDSWAAFTWGSLPTPVPGGFLCHRIFGSGRTIDYEDAQFSAHSTFCNWRIDFRYFDTVGSNYATSTGPTHYTCSITGGRSRGAVTVPRYGLACAYLYTNGRYTTKQCHNITA